MRILLCNDDGFQALGIQTLARHLRAAGHQVAIVAPSEERSGLSHAMTFFRPVLVKQIEPDTWSVHGTPADCAAIALQNLFKDAPPDLVLSGVNHGLNVGWDVNYSGTVGAATEAALLGFKAIAVSVDLHEAKSASDMAVFFNRAAAVAVRAANALQTLAIGECEVLNINHPGIEPRGLRTATCGGYSMYVPAVAEMKSERQAGDFSSGASAAANNMQVFMLGGNERRSSGDQSQDVTLVLNGYVTFSLLGTRKSSTGNNAALSDFVPGLWG